MAVHELRHVPGFLHAQGAPLSQRHVGMDESGRCGHPCHACATIERITAPQGRKGVACAGTCTLALGTVARRAMAGVDLCAARGVRRERRFVQGGIAAAGQADAGRCPGREPIAVTGQGDQFRAARRRGLAVHAEAKAVAQTVFVAVDLVVLLAIRGVHGIGAPQRRGIGLAPRIEVAVRAIESVAHIRAGMGLGVDEDVVPQLHHFAEFPFGHICLGRGMEDRRHDGRAQRRCGSGRRCRRCGLGRSMRGACMPRREGEEFCRNEDQRGRHGGGPDGKNDPDRMKTARLGQTRAPVLQTFRHGGLLVAVSGKGRPVAGRRTVIPSAGYVVGAWCCARHRRPAGLSAGCPTTATLK